MNWWIWCVLGLILLVAEMATPGGFYILFFGVGALLVGVLVKLGALEPLWLQILIFTVCSVLALLIFRRPLLEKFKPLLAGKDVDTMKGEIAFAVEDLAPNANGKVELRGSSWNARNVGATPLAKGARATVVEVDGLTLSVRAE